MPRPKLPPRLQRRADRPTDAERAAGIKRFNWVIRDGDKYVRTGYPEAEIAAAERELAKYIGEKHDPIERNRASSDLSVANILIVYTDEKADLTARPVETRAAIRRLNEFWGDKLASDILGPTCREYTEKRGKPAAARRDLEILRAAVKHYRREYGMTAEPVFTLPQKSIPRERWLTREEVARLVWLCYRSKGNDKRKHLARFILIAVYTGTRHDAILRLQWLPNTTGGWADLENARLYRRAAMTRETKKRTPPIRIPDRLLGHMRRWRKNDKGLPFVVHYKGAAVGRLEKSFRSAREAAKLGPDVIPHALRHTAITWLMQSGININEVSDFTGVSVEELQRTYWQHSPDFHANVATAKMGKTKVSGRIPERKAKAEDRESA